MGVRLWDYTAHIITPFTHRKISIRYNSTVDLKKIHVSSALRLDTFQKGQYGYYMINLSRANILIHIHSFTKEIDLLTTQIMKMYKSLRWYRIVLRMMKILLKDIHAFIKLSLVKWPIWIKYSSRKLRVSLYHQGESMVHFIQVENYLISHRHQHI